ncbi:RNA-binding protein HuSRO9 [Hanseniaspora uvarum DSM 2768]|nr:RNA-binding protein HuSRO9 [Hanseniaspora uvarum DSM 2768]
MLTVEEKNITVSADNAVEEPTQQPTETKVQSPWEEVVIVPGSARVQNGRKLPTLSDTLRNPKKTTVSSQNKPRIEVDASLKPENKEQWNPVDLSHLLITDAVPKASRNNNKRNNSNNSSKKNLSKNSHSSRGKKTTDGKDYSNKKSDSSKFDKSQSRSHKSKFETDKEYKKKPAHKSTSTRGKFDGKKFKVTDSSSSTEYSESSTSEGSSVNNSNEDKPKEEKHYSKSDKPYYKKEYHNGEYKPRNHENSTYRPYGYQKKNGGSRPYNREKYNKYNRSAYYQSTPNVPVLPKSYDYETYFKCAKQMAYYLSVENLNKDAYLVENLMDKAGYIQLSSLVNFKLLKIASKEGNFEIIMTTLYMILANHLGLSQEDKIEIGLLPNTSEYIGTDEFGVQFAYDFYVLRNRSWSIPEETREKITKSFKPVIAFHANDFYSYYIQKPEQQQVQKEEVKESKQEEHQETEESKQEEHQETEEPKQEEQPIEA